MNLNYVCKVTKKYKKLQMLFLKNYTAEGTEGTEDTER